MQDFLISLKQTEQDLLAAMANLSDEQLHFKLNAATWSVLECAEHIFVVEVGVLRMLQTETAPTVAIGTETVINREKLGVFLENRNTKVAAPDFSAPKGRFKNLPEFLLAFENKRKELYSVLEKINLTDGILIKHPLMGDMTKADWTYFIPRHTARHIAQINEIKAML
jgi:hypothetical protein